MSNSKLSMVEDWIESKDYLDDEFEHIIKVIDRRLVAIYKEKIRLMNNRLDMKLHTKARGMKIEPSINLYAVDILDSYGSFFEEAYLMLRESPEELDRRIEEVLASREALRLKKLKEEAELKASKEQREREEYERLRAKYG